MSAIVLCGGNINYNNLPIATASSNSLIPINGKPVIGWILDDLIEKHITDIVIVLQERNKRLHDFIRWAYAGRGKVSFAYVKENGSILDSLQSGLEAIPAHEPVHIVLGDTLIRDAFSFHTDTVYTGPYENPQNWCLVETDEQRNITAFYDKQQQDQPGREAIAGYYYITQAAQFAACVQQAIGEGSRELSKALAAYNNAHPIHTQAVNEWYDFGHIDHLITARRKLLQSRFFNRLVIDDKRGVITKTSTYDTKLRDELNWYKLLPPSLRILTPRLVEEVEGDDNTIRITQELYGYPNLAELYVLGDLDIDIWERAIDKLFDVHELLLEHSKDAAPGDAAEVYLNKTTQRLDKFLGENAVFAGIAAHEHITINGQTCLNLQPLMKQLQPRLEALSQVKRFSIIHGDYCFSNILYDLQTEVVRLIDPRGSFGSKGIYGDPRYDMAKLRHSICGLYDFILCDLFEVRSEGNNFTFDQYQTALCTQLGAYFDRQLAKAGYDTGDIKLIEGLLFLSMLPLHEGKPQRQLAMYLTGIRTLNQIL